MKYSISLSVFFLSLFLYFIAPYGEDVLIVMTASFLFAIEAYIVCKKDFMNRQYMSFNILFAFSFFLASYAFALLVRGTTAEVSSVLLSKVIDFNYLPKCCSLCTIAYSSYALGFLYKQRNGNKAYQLIKLSANGQEYVTTIFTIVFVLLFLQTINFLNSGGGINMSENPFLSSMFQSFLPLALIVMTNKARCEYFFQYVANNRYILSLILIISLLYIFLGDRGIVITCGLSFFATYSFCVNRLRLKSLLLIGFVGVLMMFVIRETRVGSNSLSSGNISGFQVAAGNALKQSNGVMYFFSDLTGAVNELCLGYEYKEKNGLLYPIEQTVMLPTMPFPLLPTIVAKTLFNKIPSDFGTGERLNFYVSALGDAHFGNHVVIDVYMRWGIIGVMVAFFVFGIGLSYIERRKNESLYFAALYILMISMAIYTPRNTIVYLIRPIAYVTIISLPLFKKEKNQAKIKMTYESINS